MNNLIIKDIYRACLLCKMSYYTPDEMSKIMENTSNNIFSDVQKIINYDRYFENQNIKCYVLRYNNTIFVSLNSSTLYKNNKQLDKFKENITIHNGLMEQYKTVEILLETHIKELTNATTKRLYITGYYMGGGLATIAAAILAEKYKNIYLISCFTFASPKIGNKYFKEYFNENVTCNYRVVVNDKINLITNINNYNNYNYYKHQYNMYTHFVSNDCYHVSHALLLEDNNILEFPKPKLSKTEKLFIKCTSCKSCCNNCMDELVDIDIYIDRFKSIITQYKINSLQKKMTLKTAKENAKHFETFAISVGERSDGSSNESDKTQKTPSPSSIASDLQEHQ